MSEEQKTDKPAEKKQNAKPVAMGGAPKKDKKKPWTIERCLKFARRYPNEEAWKQGAPSSYKAASSHGWLKECLAVVKPDNDRGVPQAESSSKSRGLGNVA